MNLQTELLSFYADMEARLAVCEAATTGPWDILEAVDTPIIGIFSKSIHVAGTRTENDWPNATFIAAARNQRPGEIRALVMAVRAWEKQYLRQRRFKDDPSVEAHDVLVAILTDWRASK